MVSTEHLEGRRALQKENAQYTNLAYR